MHTLIHLLENGDLFSTYNFFCGKSKLPQKLSLAEHCKLKSSPPRKSLQRPVPRGRWQLPQPRLRSVRFKRLSSCLTLEMEVKASEFPLQSCSHALKVQGLSSKSRDLGPRMYELGFGHWSPLQDGGVEGMRDSGSGKLEPT